MSHDYQAIKPEAANVISTLKDFLNQELQDRIEFVKALLAQQQTNLNNALLQANQALEAAAAENTSEANERATALRASIEQTTGQLKLVNESWRWLAMARTDFQTGAMKMMRAVAQPTQEF